MSTRRRSSTGSTAAAATSPTRRRSSLRSNAGGRGGGSRDSDVLDLGLLSRDDGGAATATVNGGGGGLGAGLLGRRASALFRVFEDDDGEGTRRLKPGHVLGTVFVAALFALLACLALPGAGHLSYDLARIPAAARRGGALDGNDTASYHSMLPLSLDAHPLLQQAVEEHVEARLREKERESRDLRKEVGQMQSLLRELQAKLDASPPGSAEGEALARGAGGAAADEAEARALLQEVEGLRAEVAKVMQQQQQQQMDEAAQCSGSAPPGVSEKDLAALREMGALQEQTRELQAQVEALQRQQQEQAAAAAAAGADASADGGAAAAAAAAAVSAFEERIVAIREKQEATEARLKELEASSSSFAADVEAAQEVRRGLAEDVARVQREAGALGERGAELETLKTVLEEAQAVRAAVGAETAGLQAQVAALEEAARVVKEGGPGAAVLQGDAASVREALAAAQAAVEGRKAMEAQLEEAQAVLARLEGTLAQAREAAATATASADGAGRQQQQQHQLTEAAERKVEDLEAEVGALRGQVELFEATVADGRTQVAAAVEGAVAAVREKMAEVVAEARAQAPQGEGSGGSGGGMSLEAVEALILEVLETKAAAAAPAAAAAAAGAGGTGKDADLATVQRLVEQAFRKHEADEVGKVDHAATTAGGRVVASMSSSTYTPPGHLVPSDWYHRMGVANGLAPREAAITAGHKKPGDCWPFPGSAGQLTVQLRDPITPTSVSLEHIPKEISRAPYSAPRRFAVIGRAAANANDPGVKLHRAAFLEYDIHGPDRVQEFELDYTAPPGSPPLTVVTLEVLDNWGHPEYTCLYRFRVHGDVAPTA